jgi:hypothetical protein
MDSDGCITFVDYQEWLQCYREANGREFVPPGPAPMPEVAPGGGEGRRMKVEG